MTNQTNKVKLHINIKNEDNTDFFRLDTEVKNSGEALIVIVGLGETIKECMLQGDINEVKTSAENRDKFTSMLQTNINKFQQEIKKQLK